MKPSFSRAVGASLCITTCAIVMGSCQAKDGRFFIPTAFGPAFLVDVTAPTLSNFRPSTNIILNDNGVNYDAVDGPGAVGEPVSGLNPSGLRVTWGTTSLANTRGTGDTYTIDIGPLVQGLQTITVQATDVAGNQSSAAFNFRLDRTAPDISANVPATGQSTQPSVTLNLSGGFTDNFGVGASEMTVLQAVNGQCNTGNPLFSTGTTPGTVVNNRYQFGANVTTFNVPVVLNGAPNDQRPRTGTYCFYLRSEDQALDRFGMAKPNISGRMFRTDYTWDPLPVQTGTVAGRVSSGTQGLSGVTVFSGTRTGVTNGQGDYSIPNLDAGTYTFGVTNLPAGYTCINQQATVVGGQTTTLNWDCPQLNFTVSLGMSYVHVGPGDSKTCARITGALTTAFSREPIALESIPGATYTISWTGPGVVGGTQRMGTLSAQSDALDRQNIDQFGTYTANVSVTYQGVTRTATGNVSVGGAQGTCPAP